MLDFYENLINEDPSSPSRIRSRRKGWDDWAAITAKLGYRLQFVGDDLLVTNPARLAKGIKLGAANSLQAQPDRHRHRDPRRHRAGHQERLHLHGFPPFRRDPGHHHLRPGCGKEHRPDQDRCSGSWRAYRQVQPPARSRRSSAPPLSTPATALSRPARSTSPSERSQRIMNALT